VSLAQKVTETLEAKNLPFTPEEVERAIRRHGFEVEGSLDDLIEEVVAGGVKRSVEVLRDFSDAFKVSLPLAQVEKLFWEGGWVCVRGVPPLEVRTGGADGSLMDALRSTTPAPSPELPKEMELHVWPGLVKLCLGDRFQAVRGRAFFKAYVEEELEKVLEDVKRLAPFLPAMGLEDLPQALERLRTLNRWEGRVEGPYVLARGAGSRTLRRGAILGDPELDAALLCEDEVVLSFPGDVEVAFRVTWYPGWNGVDLQSFRMRWGEEIVYLEEGFGEEEWRAETKPLADPVEKNPVSGAIKARLEQEVYFYEIEERWSCALSQASPRMQALVAVLAEREDPLAFLAEGRLAPHVTAQFFVDL